MQNRLNQGLHACPSRIGYQSTQFVMQQKWLALPPGQRESFKSYIVDIMLQYAAVENLSKPLQNILSKCNSILIQIVKYEWNTTWKNFIN